MGNIGEKILTDAKSRKPQYADRMKITEPQLEDLPAGVTHYSIQIVKLHDYLPINYIVVGDDYFTSLQKGDFSRLLQRVRFIEEKRLSAMDLAILFLLIEYPSRDRRLVEKVEDIALPSTLTDEMRQKLDQAVAPPNMQYVNGQVECIFFCYNIRTKGLEKFLVRVGPNYIIDGESNEVLSLN